MGLGYAVMGLGYGVMQLGYEVIITIHTLWPMDCYNSRIEQTFGLDCYVPGAIVTMARIVPSDCYTTTALDR